jgi:hypothetical protein
MKFLSFEILYICILFLIFKFSNFLKLLNFKFFLENFDPYRWYIDPPTHAILTPLPMVY